MKKIISLILSFIIFISVISSISINANAVGSYGVDLGRECYIPNNSPLNPYSKPQCTWYCWGRAYEKLGVSLPSGNAMWGHANTWDESADKSSQFTVGTEARENSILVENNPYPDYGHVAFVEKVENGYAYISEGNYLGTEYHQDRINLSTMIRDSWQNHVLSPVRYIYLKCKDHKWDSGKVTTKPTCKKDGVRTYTCTVCGEKKTNTIKHSSKYHSYKVKAVVKATLHTNGKLSKKCKYCGKTVRSKIYHPKTIKLKKTKFIYNGKKKMPKVIVKNTKGKAIPAKYYKVTYLYNKNVGKAKAKIVFKTHYSGTVSRYFAIIPKGTSLSKLEAGSKSFTAKWKKQTTRTTGYQLQYATNSKFTKGKKTVTIKDKKLDSKQISNLKAGRKYYVRIRTYKNVKGFNYFSAWSKAKKVTTKITTSQKIATLLAGHCLYEDFQVSTSDVREYRFFKNKTFEIKELHLDYVKNTAASILTEKGKYEIKGDEVILHITNSIIYNHITNIKSNKATKLPSYDKVIYYIGGDNFVCSLSLYNSKVCGRKTYYKRNKLSGKNLINFVNGFLYNDYVDHYVQFKKKTTYYSYLSIIDKCQFFESDYYPEIYYNYLKLKTPYGTQKALIITNYNSVYLEKSDAYIFNKKGKVIKYNSLPGALTKYTSNKNKLLTSCYYGSGMGNYTVMEYSSKSKNYKKNKSYDYEMSNRDSVYNKVKNKTKSYKNFSYSKYRIK